VRVAGGQAVLSPSDLVSFAACRHLIDLERAAAVKLAVKEINAITSDLVKSIHSKAQ